MGNEYVNEGVKITPEVLIAGNRAEIEYAGLLADSGADRIYMHWGYQNKWKYPKVIEMKAVDNTFKAELDIVSNGELYVAFEDSSHNWDNNSGNNYKFKVH